ALAAVLLGEAEVQADRLGVADVQVAVRLRREARVDAALVLAGAVVRVDDLLDEVPGGGVLLLLGGFGLLLRVRSVHESLPSPGAPPWRGGRPPRHDPRCYSKTS